SLYRISRIDPGEVGFSRSNCVYSTREYRCSPNSVPRPGRSAGDEGDRPPTAPSDGAGAVARGAALLYERPSASALSAPREREGAGPPAPWAERGGGAASVLGASRRSIS